MEKIWKQFQYKVNNQQIIITRYLGEDEIVEVPGKIDEMQVIRIGDYAFSECRHIIQVTLPETVREIGNHAFYNCRKLSSLFVTDVIHTMEDGAFKNCEVLRYITLRILDEKSSCIKNLLSETTNELRVMLIYEKEKQCAKLIFPKYLYDYEEFTQARVVNQVTYGAGVHYRECMNEKDVDYKRYDDLFRYVKANDTKETACLIAMGRLCYPHSLGSEAKEIYSSYLTKELKFWVSKLLDDEDLLTVEQLAHLHLFSKENIDDMIDIAHNKNKIEAVNYFMHYKRANFGVKEFDFAL